MKSELNLTNKTNDHDVPGAGIPDAPHTFELSGIPDKISEIQGEIDDIPGAGDPNFSYTSELPISAQKLEKRASQNKLAKLNDTIKNDIETCQYSYYNNTYKHILDLKRTDSAFYVLPARPDSPTVRLIEQTLDIGNDITIENDKKITYLVNIIWLSHNQITPIDASKLGSSQNNFKYVFSEIQTTDKKKQKLDAIVESTCNNVCKTPQELSTLLNPPKNVKSATIQTPGSSRPNMR